MRKLQIVSLVVLALSVILWAAGRIFLPLPDWAVRVNGALQMAAMAVLAFTSVRLLKKREERPGCIDSTMLYAV